MKTININNTSLQEILNTFLSVLLSVERTKLPFTSQEDPAFNTASVACSDEYLKHMQKRHDSKLVTGFPETARGSDLIHCRIPFESLKDGLKKLDKDLMSWSGSRNNAVKMLYPAGGFMGWHHNANAPGYNILLSWSEQGRGFFRYQDPITKEKITMQDTPGWTCKVGYYGKWNESDKLYWHCASAEQEERFTLGYIIPHEGMWSNMVEDIQTS